MKDKTRLTKLTKLLTNKLLPYFNSYSRFGLTTTRVLTAQLSGDGAMLAVLVKYDKVFGLDTPTPVPNEGFAKLFIARMDVSEDYVYSAIPIDPRISRIDEQTVLKFSKDNRSLYVGMPYCYIGQDIVPVGKLGIEDYTLQTANLQELKQTGAVAVIRHGGQADIGEGWEVVSLLTPREGERGQLFGASLDISYDDQNLLIGSPCKTVDGMPKAGAAYSFNRQTTGTFIGAFEEDFYWYSGVANDYLGGNVEISQTGGMVMRSLKNGWSTHLKNSKRDLNKLKTAKAVSA